MLSLPWFVLLEGALVLVDRLPLSSAPLSSPGFLIDALTPEQVQKYVSSSVHPKEVKGKFGNCSRLSQLSFIHFI